MHACTLKSINGQLECVTLLRRLVVGTEKVLIVLDTLTNHLVQVIGSDKKLLSKFDGCLLILLKYLVVYKALSGHADQSSFLSLKWLSAVAGGKSSDTRYMYS